MTVIASNGELCTKRMSDESACSRPAYEHPALNGQRTCIMHANIPDKDKHLFDAELERSCARDVEESDTPIDMTGFCFGQDTNFAAGKVFSRPLILKDTIFKGRADFEKAVFRRDVCAAGATFLSKSRFDGAEFQANADFGRTTFSATQFRKASFCKEASFGDAKFESRADFSWASFHSDCLFMYAIFLNEAVFNDSTFAAANFGAVQFNGFANFDKTVFSGQAMFATTSFNNKANFFGSEFRSGSDFEASLFLESADFGWCLFEKRTTFRLSRFNKSLSFTCAMFGSLPVPNGTDAVADFTLATFQHPEQVRFNHVNKGSVGFRIKFGDTDISRVDFRDVHWLKRDSRLILQDELDVGYIPQDRPDGVAVTTIARIDWRKKPALAIQGAKEELRHFNHETVASCYQQLVSNFENARNYDLAEECFVGAMEMKRRDPQRSALARYTTSVYKALSHYGSNYRHAFAVLLLIVFFFGGLFSLPWAGLDLAKGGYDARLSAWIKLPEAFLAGLFHSIEVATFQKPYFYAPARRIGRLLVALEQVIVSAQAALFLLALRRQFRR